jgi:hypothetical protein
MRYLRINARFSSNWIKSEIFVGPPDPVSNIRPVLRGNLAQLGIQRAHPYSLFEFSRQEVVGYSPSALHERRLEAFNHSFWTDVRAFPA